MAQIKIGKMVLGVCQTNCYFYIVRAARNVLSLTLRIRE